MNPNKQWKMACLLSCVLLMACSKKSGMELYQLPTSQARPVMIDNDSYYIQPNTYQPGAGTYHGCAQIGDAPSCGGG